MENRFFTVADRSFLDALHAYGAAEVMRGKSWASVLEKFMAIWLSYSIKHVPRGSREAVDKNLLAEVRDAARPAPSMAAALKPGASKAATRRAVTVDTFRFTKVARMVAKMNYRNARAAKTPEAFYAIVRRKYAAQLTSINVHVAALVMPFRALKGRGGDTAGVRKFKNGPFDIVREASEGAARVAVEAYASAKKTKTNPRPLGMQGTAGQVFVKTMRMVEATAWQWYAEKIHNAARKQGFKVAA